MLARWLPAAINTRPTEWSRAAIGMALGTLFSVWACSQVFGIEVAYHLIGPLGASAVLLFAVSSGALAQPWSIIGGYLCAGVVALLVAPRPRPNPRQRLPRRRHGADPDVLAALPAPTGRRRRIDDGAGRPDDHCHGLESPGTGDAQRRLPAARRTGLQQPHPHPLPERPAEPAPAVAPVDIQSITAEDLKRALADMEAFIDVTPEDLEQLIHASELHAKRRSIGQVFR